MNQAGPKPTVIGVLLAGGASSRLGSDKRFVRGADGKTMLERGVVLLHSVCERVLVLAEPNTLLKQQDLDAEIICDKRAYRGPLAALADLNTDRNAWYITLAVDLPNMRPHVLEALIAIATRSSSAAVVPFFQGRWQPLVALYRAEAFAVFARVVQQGQFSLTKIFEDGAISFDKLGPSQLGIGESDWPCIFANLNTPADLQQWHQQVYKF